VGHHAEHRAADGTQAAIELEAKAHLRQLRSAVGALGPVDLGRLPSAEVQSLRYTERQGAFRREHKAGFLQLAEIPRASGGDQAP
jgi:hypothetical protein